MNGTSRTKSKENRAQSPTLKDSWRERLSQGKMLAEKYNGWSYDAAVRAAVNEDPELVQPLFDDLNEYGPKTVFMREQFFKAGFYGDEPEYVQAIRYGKPPESGRSKNWGTGETEQGVSVVKIISGTSKEKDTSMYSVIYGLQGEKLYKVAGWYLGRHGSDGEPLLLDVKLIGEIKEKK